MEFANSLLEKITYDTKLTSSKIGFDNLNKKFGLSSDNIYSLAYMAQNPAITEEEREIFKKCLQYKLNQQNEELENTIKYLGK